MPLETLSISHLRNITQAKLAFSPGLNLVIGANASGKTSLLEGIAVLAQGRSFRTHRIDQLVQYEQAGMTLVAKLLDGSRRHTLGFARERKKSIVKLDGAPLARTTDLIDLQALHVITPESHEILDHGPKMRRQYLDWGVFHVKPNYLSCWQRYHRVLKQRNHVLRVKGNRQAVQAWDKQLVSEANTLHHMRQAYLEELTPFLQQFGEQLLEMELEFKYRPGWSKDCEDFAHCLDKDYQVDIERGFTHSGPHRADISVTSNGLAVKQCLSRGQQKLLICAMYLAQVALSKRPGLLLIDDLPAELDPDRRARLLSAAADTGAQLFVTATEVNLIPTASWEEKKVFHVEHGEFHEVV